MRRQRLSAREAARLIEDLVSEEEEDEHEDELPEDVDGGSDVEMETTNIIQPYGDSESDEDMSSDEENHGDLIDKNGTKWSRTPPSNIGRRDKANIVNGNIGPKPSAHKDSVLQTWQLLFTDEILEKILHYSQRKARQLGDIDFEPSLENLKAFIGICYFRGVNFDTKVPVDDLWANEAHNFYRAAMSKNMFKTWLRILRFDDASTRAQRKQTDTFAAVREIWEDFNSLLGAHYDPSEDLVIDEQLVCSRTRSPHRTFNPSKPGKYGELYRWCADGRHRFFLKGDPLIRKQRNERTSVHDLIMNLVSPYLGTGRNVTGDRYFSNVKTASILLTEHLMTYVGTLMKNKREIPPALQRKMELYESDFLFGGPMNKITLCAYAAKQKKIVHMMSSQHHTKAANEGEKKKPQIILDYNAVKSGVDSVDQMCKVYSTRFQTRRWTVVHFQNWLDIAAINTFTLFEMCHPNWSTSRHGRRRAFLKTLSFELTAAHMINRLRNNRGLQRSLTQEIEKFVGAVSPRPGINLPPGSVLRDVQHQIKRRCSLCKAFGKPTRACNLTSMTCQICDQDVCGRHSQVVGVICDNCE